MGKFLERIYKDIKNLKIQGSQAIGEAAIQAWIKEKDKDEVVKKLWNVRPTEPFLRNILRYLKNFGEPENLIKKLESDKEKISDFASKKIKSGMVVYTHCHSSSVVRSLIKAKKKGKRFEVNVTETRPFFQGRITAKELAKNGIKVTLFVDSAIKLALEKADLMFIGADVITSEGFIINKIGSGAFADLANKRGIPVYVITHSWKFEPESLKGFEEEIEKRSEKEVWRNKPKNVRICNFVFEKIDANLITGIISELGVFRPEVFVEEVKKNL
jgi:ribose 1,5-bisphosphate isomerase